MALVVAETERHSDGYSSHSRAHTVPFPTPDGPETTYRIPLSCMDSFLFAYLPQARQTSPISPFGYSSGFSSLPLSLAEMVSVFRPHRITH